MEKSQEIRSQVIKWCLLAGSCHLIDVLALDGFRPRVLSLTSYNLEFSVSASCLLSLGPRLQSLIICGGPRLSGATSGLTIKVRTLCSESRDASSEPASILGPSILAFSHLSWIRMSYWWLRSKGRFHWLQCVWAFLIYAEWGELAPTSLSTSLFACFKAAFNQFSAF